MDRRFVLSDERSEIVWQSPANTPEVNIAFSRVIGSFANYDEAWQAAKKLLDEISASATFADVRPIEECAHCCTDFDTRQPHHALVLSEEDGDEMNPDVLQVWYVARFCPDCGEMGRDA